MTGGRPLRRLQGPRARRCAPRSTPRWRGCWTRAGSSWGRRARPSSASWRPALGARDVVAVANGTEAIQLALEALGIGAGDEVITSPLTAAFTALAVHARGRAPGVRRPRSRDPERRPGGGGGARSRRARRRILPVHLYGHPADLDPLLALARERRHRGDRGRLPGHRRAATRAGRVGALSGIGALSFYPTKNLGALGDGGRGAACSDAEVAARLRQLRNGGQSDRYRHEIAGLNSRLDEMQAAILRVGLRHLEAWTERRRVLAAPLPAPARGRRRLALPGSSPTPRAVLPPVRGAPPAARRAGRRAAASAASARSSTTRSRCTCSPRSRALGRRRATSRWRRRRRARSCRCPSIPRCPTRRRTR